MAVHAPGFYGSASAPVGATPAEIAQIIAATRPKLRIPKGLIGPAATAKADNLEVKPVEEL